MPVPRMKGIFADAFLLPAVQAQKAPDEFALRAATAQIRGLLDSAYYDYDMMITSVGNVQQKKADDKNPRAARDWRVRGFGIARCADPKNQFEGTASFMTFNYPTQAEADREAARLIPGHLYRYRGRPMKNSPMGTLGPGKVGVIHGSAGEAKAREFPIPNDPFWKNQYGLWERSIPLSPLKVPLGTPVNYGTYRSVGEITKGYVGTDGKGQMNGSISFIDDSVRGELLKKYPVGLNVFLAKIDVGKGRLPTGSRVSMIYTMSKSKKKDESGARTGEDIWAGNEIAMNVEVDLSGGSAVADPEAEAVTVPGAAEAAGEDRDVV
jgi:hypothetical protein